MTKKELILHKSLALIAQLGSVNLSTSKIAEEAQVSEGLIFRHYKSKAGLISAVIQYIVIHIESQNSALDNLDAKSKIKSIMELPFTLNNTEKEYWQAAFKLVWEENAHTNTLFQSLKLTLEEAFQDLSFLNFEAEAELVMWYVYGFATGIMYNNSQSEPVLTSLRAKYGIN